MATLAHSAEDILATSEIEQETFSFMWSLNNYSAFSVNTIVTSPIFRGGPKSNHYWRLDLYPKRKSEDFEYLAIFLTLTDFADGEISKDKSIKVRFQISILNSAGNYKIERGSPTMAASVFKKLTTFGYQKMILSSKLYSTQRPLVQNDSLKIHCRIWIEGEEKHSICHLGATKRKSLPKEENVKRRKEELSIDFGKIFENSVMTDIGIVAGNNSFKAHKAVLAARSSVFAAMFQTNMLETEMNSVNITDFEGDVIKAMLEYIYTGETALLTERAPDLLQVADKYDLGGLKEDCENMLIENMSEENAANIFVMAQTYNANLLKARVIEYINCNNDKLKKSKSFQEVAKAHPTLFVDLYLSQ